MYPNELTSVGLNLPKSNTNSSRLPTAEATWRKIDEHIDLDPVTPIDGSVYLGCGQVERAASEARVKESCPFFQGTILGDGAATCGKVRDAAEAMQNEVDDMKKELASERTEACCADIRGHCAQVVEKSCEIAGRSIKSLRKVSTPCMEDSCLQTSKSKEN